MKLIGVFLLLSSALLCCARHRVEYVLITDSQNDCERFDVQYRRPTDSNSESWSWKSLQGVKTIKNDDTQLCNKTAIRSQFASNTRSVYTWQGEFPTSFKVGDGEGIQLQFVQDNHRGGYSDCWGLACDILLINPNEYIVNTIKKEQISCNDSEGSANDKDEASSSSSGALGSTEGRSNDKDSGGSSFPGSGSAEGNSSDSLQSEDTITNGSISVNGIPPMNNVSTGNSCDTSGDSTSGFSQMDEYSSSGSSNLCAKSSPIVTECLPSRVCGGSASVERGFVTEFTAPDQLFCKPHTNDTFRIITEDRGSHIPMNDDCDEAQPYVEVVFTYIFRSLDSFDEGLEVAFQNSMNGRGTWIPLWFFSARDPAVRSIHDISLGNITDSGLLNIRGYPVNFTVAENGSKGEANIRICGPLVFDEEADRGLFNWRFRWLQTAAGDGLSDTDGDVIQVYNVSITMVNGTDPVQLFQDDFSDGDKLSSDKWATRRSVKQVMNCREGNESCVEFSSTMGYDMPITSRELGTYCLNSITHIQYTLITTSSPDCLKNGDLSSQFQFPQLQYQWKCLGWENLESERLHVNTSESDAGNISFTTFVANSNINLQLCSFNHLRFRFIQTEHRGGFCDCWEVANLTATLTNGQTKDLSKSCGKAIKLEEFFLLENTQMKLWDGIAGFCRDSASVPRVFETQSGSENFTEDSSTELCDIEADSSPYKSDCSGMTDLRIEVAFDLTLGFENCDEIDNFHEGVELSVKRTTNGEWLPLIFFTNYSNTTEPFIQLSSSEKKFDENSEGDYFILRGYTVPYAIQRENSRSYNVSICRNNNNIFQDRLQFRWLQTSYQRSNSTSDVVMLDNIVVRAENCNFSHSVTLLEDGFDNQSSINSSVWDTNLTYNIHLSSDSTLSTGSDCKPSSNEALLFYQQPVTFLINDSYIITSRQAVTKEIDLKEHKAILPSKCQPPPRVIIPSTTESSSTLEAIKPRTTSLQEFVEPFPTITTTREIVISLSATTFPQEISSYMEAETSSSRVMRTVTTSEIPSITPSPNTPDEETTSSSSMVTTPSVIPSTTPSANISDEETTFSSSMVTTPSVIPSTTPSANISDEETTFSSSMVTTPSVIPSTTPSVIISDEETTFSSSMVTTPSVIPSTTPSVIISDEETTFSSSMVTTPSVIPSTTPSVTISDEETTFSSSMVTTPSVIPSTTQSVIISDEETTFSSSMVTTPSVIPSTTPSVIISDEETTFSSSMVTTPSVIPSTTPSANISDEESFEQSIVHVNESIGTAMVNLTGFIYHFSSVIGDPANDDILMPGGLMEDETVEPEISELVLSISSGVLDIAQNNFKRGNVSEKDYIAGSTLLRILDNFALNNHDASHPIIHNDHDNIVFEVKNILINDADERISLIEGEDARISIPRDIFENVEGLESIRVVSFLFRNMSGLLPESLKNSTMRDGDTDDLIQRLASPVISISLQCENATCITSNLSNPVEIAFNHTPYDTALLKDERINGSVMCVFWEFVEYNEQSPPLLFPGRWSTDGCETSFSRPNSTVCHCNHLTHFAILLSARPLVDQLSQQQTLALEITGYIGVSISLVAMAATIFVYVFLKPLHTMRNYIHIQLCVTLGIAQIIFVAGVKPHLGEGGGVPIGCRSVAVLLHYWFLVSFMWMLMEGVVLYVALVRVFIKHHARYIAAFTVASYGIPLLYVGALTVPLGFVRSDNYRKYHSYDYGYEQVCYLNPNTSFIWSIIVPVILIFLANIGFFIMAIVIMYRHQKRQHTDKTAHKVKHWLKVSISLTVVMGITWIIGFLVLEVEELFTLAYIFTICVAFQGVFIFVIFVVLSKQVRENYGKWWKAKVAGSDFLSKNFGDNTLRTGPSAQSKTPLPSYDKTDRKSSSTANASKADFLKQSQVIENSYSDSKHNLSTVALNSCDSESQRFEIGGGATPLMGPTPQMEDSFIFNVTYVLPSSVPNLDSTVPLSCNGIGCSPDEEEQASDGNINMEEVELQTQRATPNDYAVITNSFICDPLEDAYDQSSKL